MKIIYFVHDISHADIGRRVEVLHQGGAEVVLLGFHRNATYDAGIADQVISLGQTHDGNFLQRIAAVARNLTRLGQYADIVRSGDMVLARILEMLVLGAAARSRFLAGRPLVYECLDIHRLMVQPGVVGRLLRGLEGSLLRRCQAIVSSSPGFLREYFQRMYPTLPPSLVVENKVFPPVPGGRPDKAALPDGPPWRIGWFGAIRCKRSLEILSEVARSHPGLIEVVVAGRPATAVFGDIQAAFSGIPGVRYIGGFADEAELARLFASVHFAWTMDFYEAGANSDWLLPNRLYRAAYYGAVPIALATVETGHWLRRHQAGLLVDDATPALLRAQLEAMTPATFAALQQNLDHIPNTALVTEDAECAAFVRALGAPDTGAFDAYQG